MIQRSMQPSCRIHRCTLFSQPTSSEIGSATIAPEPLISCGKHYGSMLWYGKKLGYEYELWLNAREYRRPSVFG